MILSLLPECHSWRGHYWRAYLYLRLTSDLVAIFRSFAPMRKGNVFFSRSWLVKVMCRAFTSKFETCHSKIISTTLWPFPVAERDPIHYQIWGQLRSTLFSSYPTMETSLEPHPIWKSSSPKKMVCFWGKTFTIISNSAVTGRRNRVAEPVLLGVWGWGVANISTSFHLTLR